MGRVWDFRAQKQNTNLNIQRCKYLMFILGCRNVRQKIIHLVAVTCVLIGYIHSVGLAQNQSALDLVFSLNTDGFENKVGTMAR